MNYFIQAFQRFGDFSGRSRRSEFWYFYLFQILAAIAAFIIDAIIEFPVFTLLFLLVSFVPFLALTVRRLHDTGRSGWWYFISLVPFVGGIILIVFLATEGEPGENQWGQNPKETFVGDNIEDHLVP